MSNDPNKEFDTSDEVETTEETVEIVERNPTRRELQDAKEPSKPWEEMNRSERMEVLKADHARRLVRLDQMVAAGETTKEHAEKRKKELAHIYADRQNCKVCKGPCKDPLLGGADAHPLNKPLERRVNIRTRRPN